MSLDKWLIHRWRRTAALALPHAILSLQDDASHRPLLLPTAHLEMAKVISSKSDGLCQLFRVPDCKRCAALELHPRFMRTLSEVKFWATRCFCCS
jgi:hypothetical protein